MNATTFLSELQPIAQSVPQAGIRRFSARSPMPCKPEALWRVEAGFVRTITWSEDGTLVVLGIWGAGDWVGQLLTQAEPYHIECLTPVKASPVAVHSVSDLTPILLAHLRHLEALMLICGSRRADAVLLKLLQWLADRFGQTTGDGRLLDLRLTQQDLADLIGITRITVTRILGQLEQQHYIERLPLQKILLRQEDLWHYEI